MKKILLSKLRVNNNLIEFNPGMNIITGCNASGKTILYNSILYLMGLCKSDSIANILNKNDFELQCTINDQILSFKRPTQDQIIVEGDINKTFKVSELNQFYSLLISPQFNINFDESAATKIIQSSFYGDERLHSKIDRDNINSIIMGINIKYLRESKKQIEIFKSNLKNDEYSYEILKTYVNNVEKSLGNLNNAEFIKEILKKEFFSMYDEIFANKKILDEAIEAYNKIKKISDLLYSQRELILEDVLKVYLKELNLSMNPNNINIYSGSERRILEFLNVLKRTIKYMDHSFLNTTGLLISDSPFATLDTNTVSNLRKIIYSETIQENLQYIEFCHKDDSISTDWIIYDLKNRGSMNWLKID